MLNYKRRIFFRKILSLPLVCYLVGVKTTNAEGLNNSKLVDEKKDPENIYSKISNEGKVPASLIESEMQINLQRWMNNGVITPNMFYNKFDKDWHPAFLKASHAARKLALPVTLLPTTYTFLTSIDLTMFSYGFNCVGDRNNKVVLKAIGNKDNSLVFVKFQNVDRRRVGGFLIDANLLYDVAFDTSWTINGGPSLMLVWEKIQIQGWRKIGWIANNNNDVWNKNITILGSSTESSGISYFNHSPGGPVSFEGCSFSGGRVKITAQHISASFCVFRGIEIKQGGSSWNVFSSIGCHFFKDHKFNSCFIISGTVQGFTVTGGLVEPTDGGTVLLGVDDAVNNSGAFIFQGVRISSYNKFKPAILAGGVLRNDYGKNVIKITGGIIELSTLEPSELAWVDILTLDSVLVNQEKPLIMSRNLSKVNWSYSDSYVENVIVSSKKSSSCFVRNYNLKLSSSSSDFGIIEFLDLSKTRYSHGVLNIVYEDCAGFAEFSYKRVNDEVTVTENGSYFPEAERNVHIAILKQSISVRNSRQNNSNNNSWVIFVTFSGYLDYLP
ncbi:hypothetical protein J8995_21565 [Klebsiella quasipneumoniae subsp. quasipneumoniae]|uniref:hypothetical protein n=1 Tax=Klebsiella quasipneumoniae TaxID=1463165 RepID=UPI002F967CA9